MHIQEARNIKGLYIQSSKQNNIIKNGKCEIKTESDTDVQICF